MVAITGSMRYDGLAILPGTRMSPSMMTGGNIFRRGFNFLKRNTGRFLRSGVRILPHAIDRFVQLGSERGHIPDRHKKMYDDYRKYVHMVPGLLDNPIKRLEERLNTEVNPSDKTDSDLDDLAEKVIDKFEDKAVSKLRLNGNRRLTDKPRQNAPSKERQTNNNRKRSDKIEAKAQPVNIPKKSVQSANIQKNSRQKGGKLQTNSMKSEESEEKPKKCSQVKIKIDSAKKPRMRKNNPLPSLGSDKYRQLINKLVSGSGLMTHSLSEE